MTRLRCAIYTRKSSEEGLEQDFNSLDAQHEACAAYIKSQASGGWKLVRGRYDDGGISGGTLERPGLQRLLADIAVGHIDVVVVYKVDRLTRSLLDFAKLVEAFDTAGASFVSITQSFNTTTSMGRLTLNMLLSFAQFEREVTAERIRDKIAQSKARGMWMGGTPPIGYLPDGRSLAIIEGDAAIVRHIFSRYAELGNVRAPAEASLLAGKLVDDRGVPMVAVHACKGKVRYRYYVSRDLQHSGDAASSDGWRLPAREIEPLVRTTMVALLNDPVEVLARSAAEMPSPAELRVLIVRGKEAAARLAGPRAPGTKLLRDLVAEVRLGPGQVSLVLNTSKLATLLDLNGITEPVMLNVAARLKRNGRVMRLITPSGSAAAPCIDRTLVKAIVQGRVWWQELQADNSLTLAAIGRREGITSPYVLRIVRLAFLSPQMLTSIIAGTLPAHLTLKSLTATDGVAARWDRQPN